MRSQPAALLFAAALAGVTLSPRAAHAAWPNDVSLSGMSTFGGSAITAPVTDDYVQLVRELGAGLSSWSALPANTTGIDGFDAAVGTTFWFTDGYNATTPTPWQRAHPTGSPQPFQASPNLIVRKGLPMSLEVGGGMSWFAGSSQGAVHAFGRAALLEGHLPWPELAVQVGYTGYVGNDELELGVVDLGVTLGTTAPLTKWKAVTQSTISPFIGVSFLRMRATAVVPADIATQVGLVQIGGPDAQQAALTGVRVAGGFQFNSGPALFRLNMAWTAQTPILLAVSTGMGF